MEGRQVHGPPQFDKNIQTVHDESDSDKEINRNKVTRRQQGRTDKPFDFTGPFLSDRQPEHNRSNGLPHDQMSNALLKLNDKQKDTKSRRNHDRLSASSPFQVGKNTMETRTTRHSIKQVNDSRLPLMGPSSFTNNASSSKSRIDMGGRHHKPLHLDDRHPPFQTSTPRASSSKISPQYQRERQQQQHQQYQRQTSHDSLQSRADDQNEVIVVQNIKIRGQSNSRSPQKPSSPDYRRRSSDDYHATRSTPKAPDDYTLNAPGQTSSSKGKARMVTQNHSKSSPTKSYGKPSVLAGPSRKGKEPEEDPIRDPEGVFEDDSDVEVIEDKTPQTTMSRLRKVGANVLDQINRHMQRDTNSSTQGQRPSKFKGMKGKDGTVKIVSPPVDKKPPLKDRMRRPSGTIPTSFPERFSERKAACSADVKDAWFAPNQKLRIDTLRLSNKGLQAFAHIGLSGTWWDIELNTINKAEICRSQDCPFVSLTLSVIARDYHDRIESMMTAKGPHDYNLEQPTSLFVILKSGGSAQNFIDALWIDLVNRDAQPCKLDEKACGTLRASCNSQIRDTRAQADNIKRAKLREAAEKRKEEEQAKARPRGQRKSSAKEEDEPSRPKTNAKEKQGEDPNQSKLSFAPAPKVPERRSGRRSAPSAVQNVDGSESDESAVSVKAKPAATRKLQFNGDRNELLFPYPPQGRADVNITIGDAQRIETGEFLNDTLLEFGLRHVLRNLQEEIQQTVHLFNSFFYERLSNKAKKAERGESGEVFWPGYESVKKWSKGKDIFDKKYIVIPINEHFHWYLAVIINPAGILRPKPKPDAAILGTAGESENEIDTASRSTSDVDDQLTTGKSFSREDEDLNDLDSEDGKNGSSQTSPQAPERIFVDDSHESMVVDDDQDGVGDETMQSQDPLDCIDKSVDEGTLVSFKSPPRGNGPINDVSRGVEGMGISDKESEEDMIGPGNPIFTSTLLAVQQQSQHARNPSPQPAATSQPKKRASTRPDAQILNSENTWIITFDSMGGPHRAVGQQLNMWLRYEAKDKKGIDYDPMDALYWEGRVPLQPNFYDCGLYVVHYAKQFLENSQEVLKFVQRRPAFSNTVGRKPWEEARDKAWKQEETNNLRDTWTGMMVSLAANYQSIIGIKPDQPNKQDQNENHNEDNPNQEIIDDSQDDPIAEIGASQFFQSAPIEDKTDLIPGSFPAHDARSESLSPAPTSGSKLNTPGPSETTKPVSSGPKWAIAPKSPTPTRARSSTNELVDPNLRNRSSPATRSRKSLSPQKDPSGRNFTNHPINNRSTPGRESMQQGSDQKQLNLLDPLNFENRINGESSTGRRSSPVRQSRKSDDRETRHQEVEQLRPPKRTALAEITDTSSSSITSVKALGSEAGNVEIETSDSAIDSPLAKLSRGIPGKASISSSTEDLPRPPPIVSANIPKSHNGIGTSNSNQIPSSPLTSLQTEEQESEEEEQIEVDKPPIQSPLRTNPKTYGSKQKGKRVVSNGTKEIPQNNKKIKTNPNANYDIFNGNPATRSQKEKEKKIGKGKGNGNGGGQTMDEPINVDTDDED